MQQRYNHSKKKSPSLRHRKELNLYKDIAERSGVIAQIVNDIGLPKEKHRTTPQRKDWRDDRVF